VDSRIRKVGNSLGILIPAEVIRAANLKEGDDVAVTVGQGGRIELRRNTFPISRADGMLRHAIDKFGAVFAELRD
jgi:AbrB family looped-hinge helix DNA binding protein